MGGGEIKIKIKKKFALLGGITSSMEKDSESPAIYVIKLLPF